MKTTYYTAGDSAFFIGLVVLVNSLALTGNDEELVVLDLGLAEDQRRVLSSVATVVPVPPALTPRLANLVKPVVHRVRATDVAVWIDSDMMVTGSLGPLVERAAAGAICVFPDPESDRWFPEWEELFDLRAPLTRRQYVNTGFFALSTKLWGDLLDRWLEMCERIPPERTLARGASKHDPFWASDQEPMNALLMSEVPPDAVEIQDEDEEIHCHVPGPVEIIDEQTLHVRRGESRVRLLHQSLVPKPWMTDGWKTLQPNPYVRLAPRVLFGEDVPLRLEPRVVPPWLRPGYAGEAARTLAIGAGRGRLRAYSYYYRLPSPLREPIRKTMRRLKPHSR